MCDVKTVLTYNVTINDAPERHQCDITVIPMCDVTMDYVPERHAYGEVSRKVEVWNSMDRDRTSSGKLEAVRLSRLLM